MLLLFLLIILAIGIFYMAAIVLWNLLLLLTGSLLVYTLCFCNNIPSIKQAKKIISQTCCYYNNYIVIVST